MGYLRVWGGKVCFFLSRKRAVLYVQGLLFRMTRKYTELEEL